MLIRTFIALTLPPDARAALADFQSRLRTAVAGDAVRWVRPALLHVTIRFLGDTDEERLPALRTGLHQLAAMELSGEVTLGAAGCFPNRRRPRVIWVGVRDASGVLPAWHEAVESLVESLGWERERRPFSPHITLGRVWQVGEPLPLPWDEAPTPVAWTATRLHLIRSDLRRDGPVYTRLT